MIETITKYRIRTGQEFATRQAAETAETLLDLIDLWQERQAILGNSEDRSARAIPQPVDDVQVIKDYLREQDVSGRTLASRAAISPGTLSDILCRKMPLSDHIREKLIRAMTLPF